MMPRTHRAQPQRWHLSSVRRLESSLNLQYSTSHRNVQEDDSVMSFFMRRWPSCTGISNLLALKTKQLFSIGLWRGVKEFAVSLAIWEVLHGHSLSCFADDCTYIDLFVNWVQIPRKQSIEKAESSTIHGASQNSEIIPLRVNTILRPSRNLRNKIGSATVDNQGRSDDVVIREP